MLPFFGFFPLSTFFLILLRKPSTPVLSWMQNTFLLSKATFLFNTLRFLPLDQCHEAVDSHSVCEPLNPLCRSDIRSVISQSVLVQVIIHAKCNAFFPLFDWTNNYQFSSYWGKKKATVCTYSVQISAPKSWSCKTSTEFLWFDSLAVLLQEANVAWYFPSVGHALHTIRNNT